MEKNKQTKRNEQKSNSKYIKLNLRYLNEGQSLQEGWKNAPKGTKLVLNGQTLAVK